MVQQKRGNMGQVKSVLCLGNQTEDSCVQSNKWADQFGLVYQGIINPVDSIQHGVFLFDPGCASIDDLWKFTDVVDLIIMLDQPVDSFDYVETYQHLINLCRYKKQFMPVMIAKNDAPAIWLNNFVDNQEILPTIVEQNIQNSNLVIKLCTVTNIDLFSDQLRTLVAELNSRNCKWVFYRAGEHEPLHYEVTRLLLSYSEFVLLNPGVFTGNMSVNINQRIYNHWVDLYFKNNNERFRI